MLNQKVLTELKDKVKPERCALLVIDVQNDFCADGGWYSGNNDLRKIQSMVPRLDSFLKEARAQGVLTVLIKTIYNEHVISPVMKEKLLKRGLELLYCVENTWGADWYVVQPESTDVVITKQRHSAFFGTELDTVLKNHGIETLILAGVATNVCVDCTARDGFARDYYIVMLSDCTATFSEDLHKSTLENMDKVFGVAVDSKEVSAIWKKE